MIYGIIEQRLLAVPFREFELLLADGRALRVEHPENVGRARGARIIGVMIGKDVAEQLDVALILGVRYRDPGFVHADRPPQKREPWQEDDER